MRRLKLLVGVCIVLGLNLGAVGMAEEKPTGLGSLFDRLTGTEKESKTEEGNGGSVFGDLLNRAKTLSEETYERSKQGLTDLMDSSSEANAKMEGMLSFLDEKLAGREPSFSEAEIQAHAEKLVPLVEELNQRQFNSPPKVKSVGNFQMIQIMARDLAPQFERQLPETPQPLIYLRAYLSAGLIAPSLLGKYGVEDHTVYLLPQNVSAVMEMAEIDPELEEQILQIVIGHELTHGLQDQEIGLSRTLESVGSPDGMQAFNSTIEGHAVLMQNALAERLGYQEAATAASTLLMAPEMENDEWLYDRVAMASAVQWEQTYLGGERFMEHHLEEGGMEKVWEILATPPDRTSMIIRPETYTTKPAPLPDLQHRFAFAPAAAGLDSWNYIASPMGDFDVLSHLATVPRAQREAIMVGLREDVVVRLNHPSSLSSSISLVLFEFASEVGAKQMVEAMEELNRQDLAGLEAGLLVDLKSQSNRDYAADSGIAGSALRYQTESLLLGETTTTVIQCQDGRVAAQLVYEGVDLTKTQIDQLIGQCVSELAGE
ncbi:MAG: hypothetical protein AAGH89_08610 [Verrucomicrobiota bacterium]